MCFRHAKRASHEALSMRHSIDLRSSAVTWDRAPAHFHRPRWPSGGWRGFTDSSGFAMAENRPLCCPDGLCLVFVIISKLIVLSALSHINSINVSGITRSCIFLKDCPSKGQMVFFQSLLVSVFPNFVNTWNYCFIEPPQYE